MDNRVARIVGLAKTLAKVVSGRAELTTGRQSEVGSITQVLQAFHGIAVHLKGRGKFAVSSEAEVQDLMYSILKPILPDLYDENPQPKAGIISSRPDFTSRAAKAFFEAKFVNSKSHAKSVQREMQTDIEQYAHSQDCNEIWFYVYDPHNHIADAEAMRKAIERDRTLDGRRVTARLIVQPK